MKRHLTFSNVIAAIALFVVLGGTAVAAVGSTVVGGVNPSGTLFSQRDIVSSSRTGTGVYVVTFNRSVKGCAFTGSLRSANGGSLAFQPSASTPARVAVRSFHANGTPQDRAFYVLAHC